MLCMRVATKTAARIHTNDYSISRIRNLHYMARWTPGRLSFVGTAAGKWNGDWVERFEYGNDHERHANKADKLGVHTEPSE